MSIIEITVDNLHILNRFIENTIPLSFRYFNNKSVEQIITNHYKTILYIAKDAPVGYGHIDYDIANDKYWVGLCVLPEYQGIGIGKSLLNKILDYFKDSDIDSIHLSVDKNNLIAVRLYEKYGFKLMRSSSTVNFMSLYKNTMYLPVSYGEAFDKLTILDIKLQKIEDTRRLDVEIEYNKLNHYLSSNIKSFKLYYDILKLINLKIWEDQDIFRYSSSEDEKLYLCKQIIQDNDTRFRVKNKINHLSNSLLKEQKGYTHSNFEIYITSPEKYSYKLINSIILVQSLLFDKILIKCSESIVNLLDIINDQSIVFNFDIEGCCDNIDTIYNTLKDNYIFKYIYSILDT